MVKQISVFLENAPGTLSTMTRALADAGVNLHVLAIADTSEYGVARIICDDPYTAQDCLLNEGFSVAMTPVCAVELADTPGALADFLDYVVSHGVDIAYTYCFVEPHTGNAVNIFRLDDPSFEKSIQEAGYRIVSDEDIVAK